MTNDSIVLPFTIESTVELVRGLGYSGKRILIRKWEGVESEFVGSTCPNCGYDRVKETRRVHPEGSDEYEYRCQGCNRSKTRMEAEVKDDLDNNERGR